VKTIWFNARNMPGGPLATCSVGNEGNSIAHMFYPAKMDLVCVGQAACCGGKMVIWYREPVI